MIQNAFMCGYMMCLNIYVCVLPPIDHVRGVRMMPIDKDSLAYKELAHERMKSSIQVLGEDIILENICQYLAVTDIKALASCCKALREMLSTNAAYHLMFLKMFGSYGPFGVDSYDWKSLFEWHSSKLVSLFTWGSGGNGRLGYLLKEILKSALSLRTLGVCHPCKVANFDGMTLQSLLAGGFSFQVLAEGQIFSTGVSIAMNHRFHQPGPSQNDYVDAVAIRKLQGPNTVSLNESSLVTRMKLPRDRIITAISSGRQHFVALDDRGQVLTWDNGTEDWTVGVYLNFNIPRSFVTRVKAGWNSTACYLPQSGLLVILSRENVRVDANLKEWPSANAIYRIVPKLKHLVDFIALDGCVVFIDESGCLKLYTIDGENQLIENPQGVSEFNEWLTRRDSRGGSCASFTKLVGCFKTLVTFTNEGLVLIGKFDDEKFRLTIIPELQNRSIVDVAVGDYHFLALTVDGELLSWGLELQKNGCLGLGDASSFKDPLIVREEGRSFRVLKPTVIKKPKESGRWLRLAGAGWHSGAFFASGIRR